MSIFFRKKDRKSESPEKTEAPPVLIKKEDTLKPKKKEVVKSVPKTRRALETRRRLVTRPLLTEKATSMEGQQKYVFQVSSNANKNEIKKEIEQLFDVEVVSVNIINKKRKSRLWKGKAGWSSGMKKAIVTVSEGNKIEILPH